MAEELNRLEERIQRDGKVLSEEILKVDGFLNHQIDTDLLEWIGEEFAARFAGCGVTKVLTLEASGIAIAAITACKLHVPMVFAKKAKSANLGSQDTYNAVVHSFTYGKDYTITVVKKYLAKEDRILIIDDFLANGKAALGLLDLCAQAGASVEGAGFCVEKCFEPGGAELKKRGIRTEALAAIESMDPAGGIRFRKE